MDEPLYRVVFAGALTGEFDETTSRRNFARLFRLNEARAATYFTGKERVIKSDLTEAAAMDYMIKVSEIGCECFIEAMTGGPPAGIDERRRSSERRNRFRRKPRPGAIVPDRRLTIRRAIDRRDFRNIKSKGLDLPLSFQSYGEEAASN